MLMSKVVVFASVIASSAIVTNAARIKASETDAAVVDAVPQATADSLNDDARFDGETAFDGLCSFYQEGSRQSHTYKKEGDTMNDASTLVIDCKSKDDDIIDVTYSRHKFGTWSGMSHDRFGIYKTQKSLSGQHLLFKKGEDGSLAQEGCESWMQTFSWCEGLKWSKNDDLIGEVEWDITYTWLRKEKNVLVLDYDRVKGWKGADDVITDGLKFEGLGDDIGAMGPAVGPPKPWYTVGVTGYTEACTDNDKPKGGDLSHQDKKCEVKVFKTQTTDGILVSTKWKTTHVAIDEKKRFSL